MKFVKDWGLNILDSVPSETKNLVFSCQKIYQLAVKVLNSEKTEKEANQEFKTSLPLCATLLWKCHELYEIVEWRKSSYATFDLPESMPIELVRQCASYSSKVYDIWPELNQSMPLAISRIKEVYGCLPTDIVAHGFLTRQPGEVLSESIDLNLPKFTLTVDHTLKKFVICIRGTFSIEDAVTDMLCDDEPFCDGIAHSGIIAAVLAMEKNFKGGFMKALEKYPQYGVILTGHSLGGGTAVLMTLRFYLDTFWSGILKDRDVKCVALAPPPVYKSSEQLAKNVLDSVHIFVNNGDLVPRASMATLAQFITDIKSLDETNPTPLNLVGLIRRNDAAEVEKYHKLLDSKLQSKFLYLQHPGKCYRISITDTDELAVQRIESEAVHNKVVLFKSLIADHSIIKYNFILQKHPYLSSETTANGADSSSLISF